MFGTRFRADSTFDPVPVAMANHTLALAVTVASFVICGTFLLATTSFLTHNKATAKSSEIDSTTYEKETENSDSEIDVNDPATVAPVMQIPFERNKKIEFADSATVGAIRADGHYTHLYTKDGVRFCPWSITEAEKRLSGSNFHRTHRSYLVNIDEVNSFERKKETGTCLFEGYPQLSNVPVSRNRIIDLTRVLNPGKQRLEALLAQLDERYNTLYPSFSFSLNFISLNTSCTNDVSAIHGFS